MKAIAVTPGVRNSLAMTQVPDPKIGERDVLVEVLRVGVCGTDREIREGVYGKAPPGSDYLVIGHESLGQVAAVGPNVEGFTIGDYVVASVRRPCPHERCLPCRGDRYDMCITGDYSERGIVSHHGYLAEYYSENQRFLTKIPAEIERVGVLLEPLSIVEKAVRQTFEIQERLPWAAENAIVLGAGAIGLLGAMLLRLRGINTCVLDRSEPGGPKSQLIQRFGAHHVDTRQTPLSEVAAGMGPVDLVLEATGYAPLVFEAHQVLAMDGLLCLVGVSGESHDVTVAAKSFNNRLVLGNRLIFGSVNAGLEDFRAGVGHIRQIEDRWPGLLESTITRHTPFDQFQSAFEPQREDIKLVIETKS